MKLLPAALSAAALLTPAAFAAEPAAPPSPELFLLPQESILEFGFLRITRHTFAIATPTGMTEVHYQDMPADTGDGTAIVDFPRRFSPDPFLLTRDTSLFALRTAASLATPAAQPTTLHLTGGRLIVYPWNDRSSTVTFAPHVHFGASLAQLHVDGMGEDFKSTGAVFTGNVHAPAGLLKTGAGVARLPATTYIGGPITLSQGSVWFNDARNLGAEGAITFLNHATLGFEISTHLARPVLLTACSGSELTRASIVAEDDLTLAAPVSGPGNLILSANSTLRFDAPVNVQLLTAGAPEIAFHAPLAAAGVAYLVGKITGEAAIKSSLLILNQSTLSPGAGEGDIAPFIAHINELDMSFRTTIELDIGPAGSDRLLISGILNLMANPDEQLANWQRLVLRFTEPPAGDEYLLISAASINGRFSEVLGLDPAYQLVYTPTTLSLVPRPIPEPASLPFFAAAWGALLLKRRRPMHKPQS